MERFRQAVQSKKNVFILDAVEMVNSYPPLWLQDTALLQSFWQPGHICFDWNESKISEMLQPKKNVFILDAVEMVTSFPPLWLQEKHRFFEVSAEVFVSLSGQGVLGVLGVQVAHIATCWRPKCFPVVVLCLLRSYLFIFCEALNLSILTAIYL